MRRASEKQVQTDCDRLMASLGYTSIHFSQARATMQTPGIPDRKYYNGDHTFWLEVKATDGRQSNYQRAFELLTREAGEDYVLGGLEELMTYLQRKGKAKWTVKGTVEHRPINT